MCVAMLGCTSAVASLVMIFNVVTGFSGLVFVLLSIFIYSWSAGNEWAAAMLAVAGSACSALAFFGFKVAEVVLSFVKETNQQMSAQDHLQQQQRRRRRHHRCCCCCCCAADGGRAV